MLNSGYAQIGSTAKGFLIDKPKSWFPVVLRLPEGADEVVSFDVMYQQGGLNGNIYAGRNPTAFSIEASVDGVVWEEVGGLTDIPIKELKGSSWVKGLAPYADSQGLFTLSGAVQKHDDMVLTGVGEVSVASGATLRFEHVDVPVSELRLAADGNGTFENVVFAASGTVTVDKTETGRVTVIPAVFLNCTTLGNLAGWELRCPGKNVSAYRLRVGSDGSLRIVPPGFSVVLK